MLFHVVCAPYIYYQNSQHGCPVSMPGHFMWDFCGQRGIGTDFSFLLLRLSSVRIIPPVIHTFLHLNVVLTVRTKERRLGTFQEAKLFRKFRTIRKKVTVTLILAEVIPLCYNTQMWPYEYSLTQTDLVLLYLFTGDRFRSSRPSSDKLYCYYYYYLFVTCNWVDTRWLGSLHVTLALTIKILL